MAKVLPADPQQDRFLAAVGFSRHDRRSKPFRRLPRKFRNASRSKNSTLPQSITLNLDPSTFGSLPKSALWRKSRGWFLLVEEHPELYQIISAYDKEVSDDLYAPGSRYVSKQRLEAMLDNEWTSFSRN